MSRPSAAPLATLALIALGALPAPHALAGIGDLYVTSDASDDVRQYAGTSGAYQSVFTPSFAASGQLGIHFGATNNRVLVGHWGGGVEEFDASTGAYIKTYNPGGGTQWAGIYAPTGGVYIGGGIAPKILSKLKSPIFLEAFAAKGRLRPLMEAMPVSVILDDKTALRGAARRAAQG